MATLYCFSSTGNCLYTAHRIADEIGGMVLPMRTEYNNCEDDVIGLVFPVYYWGVPRIVAQFVSQLTVTNKNVYFFAVTTYGGSPFGATGMLKKLLKSRGITLHYGAELVTVTNYLPRHDVNDSEALRHDAEKNLHEIIEHIRNRDLKQVSSFTAINNLGYMFFPGKDSDRDFTVSSRCTGCGICRKVCPVGNIVMQAEKPYFKHNCEHCLGCLHHCPAEAIDWKGKTEGKMRYRHPEVSLDELIAFAEQK